MHVLKNLAALAGLITLATALTVETHVFPNCGGPSDVVEVKERTHCIRTERSSSSLYINHADPRCRVSVYESPDCNEDLLMPYVPHNICFSTGDLFNSVLVVCSD